MQAGHNVRKLNQEFFPQCFIFLQQQRVMHLNLKETLCQVVKVKEWQFILSQDIPRDLFLSAKGDSKKTIKRCVSVESEVSTK